jgi:hypothetical protein
LFSMRPGHPECAGVVHVFADAFAGDDGIDDLPAKGKEAVAGTALWPAVVACFDELNPRVLRALVYPEAKVDRLVPFIYFRAACVFV